jgi:hypothetical protein
VAGPWVAMGNTDCPAMDPHGCSPALVVLRLVLMGFDGVVQAGSLAVLGEAWFMRTRLEARSSPATGWRRTAPTAPLQLRVAPMSFPAVSLPSALGPQTGAGLHDGSTGAGRADHEGSFVGPLRLGAQGIGLWGRF